MLVSLLFAALSIGFSLLSALDAQERATTRQENTAHLISHVSGHARDVDQLLGRTRMLTHGLAQQAILRVEKERPASQSCVDSAELIGRSGSFSSPQYNNHTISLREAICLTAPDVVRSEVASSMASRVGGFFTSVEPF